MQILGFVLLATGIIGFGAVSGRAQRSIITPPMVFAAYGFVIGPSLLGLQSFQTLFFSPGWPQQLIAFRQHWSRTKRFPFTVTTTLMA